MVRFISMENLNEQITFRRLQPTDFPLLVKWLNAPQVNAIYDKKQMSIKEVEKKYLPRTHAENKVASFVVLLSGKPIGHLQSYLIDDDPKYKATIQIEGKAGGVDIFIGEKDMIGKGLGSAAIRKFVDEIMFPQMAVELVVMGPNPSNISAIKAYEKAGFNYLKTVYNPEEKEEEYLMIKKKI